MTDTNQALTQGEKDAFQAGHREGWNDGWNEAIKQVVNQDLSVSVAFSKKNSVTLGYILTGSAFIISLLLLSISRDAFAPWANLGLTFSVLAFGSAYVGDTAFVNKRAVTKTTVYAAYACVAFTILAHLSWMIALT